jgi:hypothetical protein
MPFSGILDLKAFLHNKAEMEYEPNLVGKQKISEAENHKLHFGIKYREEFSDY